MWFKNLRIYSFDAENMQKHGASVDLAAKLEAYQFHPCGSLDPMRYGFVEPIADGGYAFFNGGQHVMICAKRQEKILPAGVINERLAEIVAHTEVAESRSVGRKERQTLRDEVIFSLLPKALTKSSYTHGYIDYANSLIVINAASASAAEDFLSKLREALGSLKCYPLQTKSVPSQAMTHWVNLGFIDNPVYGLAPKCLQFGYDCHLDGGKDGRVVTFKNQDLSADEVNELVRTGMTVEKLGLEWRESVSFQLCDDLAIKRLKFADLIQDKANDHNPESKAEQFAVDFAIMSATLSQLIADLVKSLGGEADNAC